METNKIKPTKLINHRKKINNVSVYNTPLPNFIEF